MMTWVAFVVRLRKWELITVAIASVGVGIYTALAVVSASGIEVSAVCPEKGSLEALGAECQRALMLLEGARGSLAQATLATAILPFGAGILLGGPIVASEIESGSAGLVWWLAESRRRWLLRHVVILGLIALAFLVPLALLIDRLEEVARPDIVASQSFLEYGFRGPVMALRGVAMLAAATLVGAFLGRTLPALIVSATAGIGLAAALFVAFPYWMPSEVLGTAQEGVQDRGVAMLRSAHRGPDGRLHSLEKLVADSGMGSGPDFADWYEANGYYEVILGYPGGTYPEVVIRESLALMLATGASVLLAIRVTERRRPY